ncbi:MAG: right-handed parallel beta-helix repeat-containing protein, partial [Myxococcota bacterium]|nr:right-handed parallel beta-helix repeat-containing protein [Myxococcota bacterium]
MSVLYLLLSPSVYASTLTVGTQYPTIQSAIQAAQSGDTIIIPSGNYSECLDLLGKNLSLEGNGSATVTGSGCTYTVVADQGEQLNLSGLTIDHTYGRGISAQNSNTSIVLDNVSILSIGANSWDGSAIYASGASVTITNSEISNMSSSRGAIFLEDFASLTIEDSIFDSNDALNGGVVYAENDTTVIIEGSSFVGNSTRTGGFGAVATVRYDSAITVSNSTFTGNSSGSYAGALYVEQGQSVNGITQLTVT